MPLTLHVPVAQKPINDRVERGHDEEPDKTRHNERRIDERGVEQELPGRVLAEAIENGGKLLADEDEEHRLQEEDEHLPEGDVLDARRGVGEDPRVPPTAVEAVGDDGQHARDMQYLLGKHVDNVGRKQRERDEDGRIPNACPQR